MKQSKLFNLLCLPLAVVTMALVLALPTLALADDIPASETGDWHVTFTSDEKMKDDFSAFDFASKVKDLQPGDSASFQINLAHEHNQSADWYISNEVMKTLEEGARNGGIASAYGYYLVYDGPSGHKVLYDSESVGGDVKDDGEGLSEATGALKDYMYLDRLSKGQTAKVTLKVSMDGETEGNAYFDTLARLKLRFAVELLTTASDGTSEEQTQTTTASRTSSSSSNRTPVKTGDETRLFPFYVAMVISGLLLLALAVQSLRLRKQQRKEGTR